MYVNMKIGAVVCICVCERECVCIVRNTVVLGEIGVGVTHSILAKILNSQRYSHLI